MKKVFAILMCLVMVMTFMPTTAWAGEGTPQSGVIYQVINDEYENEPTKTEEISASGITVDNSIEWYYELSVVDSVYNNNSVDSLKITVSEVVSGEGTGATSLIIDSADSSKTDTVYNNEIEVWADINDYTGVFGINNRMGMLKKKYRNKIYH